MMSVCVFVTKNLANQEFDMILFPTEVLHKSKVGSSLFEGEMAPVKKYTFSLSKNILTFLFWNVEVRSPKCI